MTTAAEGQRAGCVVGFHSQSSISPARYCVWLSKANHTYRVMLRASHVALHLVGKDDHTWVEHFGAQSGDDVDKFAGLAVSAGPGGVPLLDDLPNRLVGRRRAVLDLDGDHVCVELEIEQASSSLVGEPMRLHRALDLTPGHEPDERAIHP